MKTKRSHIVISVAIAAVAIVFISLLGYGLMLDPKRTFDEIVEWHAPDERTRDAVLSNRIYQELSNAFEGGGAFKSLSYYLGFLAVFVLVASTIKTQAAMDTVVRALVIGATIVAFSAISPRSQPSTSPTGRSR